MQPRRRYLQHAQRRAEEAGYDPSLLSLATDRTLKLVYDGVPFGAAGYMDYILYLDQEGPAVAAAKRRAYRARARATMRRTRSRYSPASLAYNILW